MKEDLLHEVNLQDGHGPQRFRGVTYDPLYRQWTAHITFDGRRMFGGYHPDPVSAARAYDSLAKTYHGHKARPNSPLVKVANECLLRIRDDTPHGT